MRRIVWFEQYTAADRSDLGAKNASLAELTCAGLPVPPGFAVTAAAYTEAIHGARLASTLAEMVAAADPARHETVAEAGRTARKLVSSMPRPDGLDHDVRDAYAELCRRYGISDVPVAVRSSATCEDLPDASFAGEHDSYLWVRGPDELLGHISQCWASLFTNRAICYRRQQGHPETRLAMGVVVQKMVQPLAAGVAFTLNPHDGDRSQVAIDASWGFGEAVVSGEVNPDHFLVDKVTGEIGRHIISHKEIEYRLTAAGRVERATVDTARQDAPCLAEAEIKVVAALARRAERYFGCPQDVEWAVDAHLSAPDNTLLLQSRPETVWSRKPPRPQASDSYMTSIMNTLVAPLQGRSRTEGDR
jgi:pyruvate, water dikinase